MTADEVRSLVSRTSRAADDIRQMVEGLQNETQKAVSFMEEGVKDVDNSLRAQRLVMCPIVMSFKRHLLGY